jgi:hypothetical protein
VQRDQEADVQRAELERQPPLGDDSQHALGSTARSRHGRPSIAARAGQVDTSRTDPRSATSRDCNGVGAGAKSAGSRYGQTIAHVCAALMCQIGVTVPVSVISMTIGSGPVLYAKAPAPRIAGPNREFFPGLGPRPERSRPRERLLSCGSRLVHRPRAEIFHNLSRRLGHEELHRTMPISRGYPARNQLEHFGQASGR